MNKNHGSTAIFTDTELWQYHAYDYAWREHFLGSTRIDSPIDPAKDWWSESMFKAARTIYANQHVAEQRPADEHAVREHWRKITYKQLTRAEQILFHDACNETMQRNEKVF